VPKLRSLREWVTTKRLERLMASPDISGFRKPAAAIGIAAML
jgi:hypothetical protein